MEEQPEYIRLFHKRSCLERELDIIIQLGSDAKNCPDSFRKFMVSCHELGRIQDQFEQIQTGLEDLEIKETKKLSSAHTEIRLTFNDLIRNINSIKYEFEEQKKSLTQSVETNNNNKQENIPVQLPRLSIPPFSGDYKQWNAFSDLFTSLIDHNKNLSDVAKFQYLLSYVRGDASKLLRGLPITDSNYKKAWSILEYNYKNERLIAMQHMDALYKLPNLNTPSASGLRVILSGFLENTGALEAMGFPIDQWDFMLYFLLYRKIDPATRRDFDKSISTYRIPKFHELQEFLNREIVAWESSRATSRPSAAHFSSSSKPHTTSTFVASSRPSDSNKSHNCHSCKSNSHSLTSCHSFKSKKPYDRFVFAKQNKLCLKCLKPMHEGNDTCSKIKCSICDATHHNTLLHFAKTIRTPKEDPPAQAEEGGSANLASLCSAKSIPQPSEVKTVLLSTAVVLIRDTHGNYHKARALVDPGSEASFISQDLVTRLGLSRHKFGTPIQGIGDVSTRSKGSVTTVIKSRHNSGPEFNFCGLILNHITSNKPSHSFDSKSWSHLTHLILADPNFASPSPVDLLLGGDIYEDIFVGETIRGPIGTPMAISSSLGWLLIGKVDAKFVSNRSASANISSFVASSQEENLDRAIRKFWEIESVPEKLVLSPDDQLCEDIFVRSHTRLESGRFVVSLPFRDGEPSLGESRSLALKRLISMERRFARDDQFRKLYFDFMDDYLKSGHMELVSGDIQESHYFIPHHGVLRPSSSTTKLRVVFDASAVASQGNSLNDTQLIGPKLQRDIADLICNFRFHSVAFTADIRQMFRMILVAEKHQNYQLILWRTNPHDTPQVYRLKTVTYGLSSSPFLAIRVLQQLAADHQSDYPEAAEVIRRYTYMDDVISGSSSLGSALHLQNQLFELLKRGGFELRKWCSNSSDFLQRLPDSAKDIESSTVSLDEDSSVKVLGIAWQPVTDMFSYHVKPLHDRVTKRVILSETARIFDPVGFLSPVIIAAKILIQELWLAGVDWDAEVPNDIRLKWLRIVSEFPELANVQIPRFIPTHSCRVELHGFCDSSEAAYAAVVYLRVVHPDQHVSIHILIAKSRVAPLKKLSVPRLELCSASLLSSLFAFVRSSLGTNINIINEVAWTDSSIVLCWLRAAPHNWTTYVANRVVEIQNNISPEKWRHIRSSDNPADIASRGLSPSQIGTQSLWWSGPSWLSLPEQQWPVSSVDVANTKVPERRQVAKVSAHSAQQIEEPDFITRFSSFHKLTIIISYCLRFIKNCRSKVRTTGPLTVLELNDASSRLVSIVQNTWFGADIRSLKSMKSCSNRLQRLNPFLDEQGLIRVGGRLKNSEVGFKFKHPLVLPPESNLSKLIADHFHLINLHSGLQATLANIARYYWIISARRVVKKRIFLCMKCYRQRPSVLEPKMADLPEARVRQVRPFVKVAVDYAGPILTKTGSTRKAPREKSYICVFTCLTTRALHVELVSNLSTAAFMAALRRFISRRGMCSDIYSDNGRNFVGASSELRSLFNLIKSENRFVAHSLLKYKITWHFNPAAAPHFTGMAEAAVKSIKSHLVRIVGNTVLTFEEMSTVLTQIECTLNSRPLCPISSDPNDLEALTPGHFLIGEPLNSFSDHDVTALNENRLTRWQLLQRIVQVFWKRWHREYLHTLQQRGKWTKSNENIKLGALVLISEPNIHPLQWKLGRVTELHPSKDGVVRAVSLKTQQGFLKRPVIRLCPLPISD